MKQKSREESVSANHSWFLTKVSNGDTVGEGTYSKSNLAKWAEIKYGVGRDRYNPCVHFTMDQEIYHYPLTQFRREQTSDSFWDHGDDPGTCDLDAALDMSQWLHGKVSEYSPGWTMFSQRAIEAMTPSMETGFSLGNFIYEIKELRSFIKWWRKGKRLFKNFSRARARKELDFQAYSDAVLQWNFGIKPFIRDLYSIYEGLSTVRDRLAALKAGAGKLQVRHYTEAEHNLSWDEDIYHNGGEILSRYKLSVPELRHTATMTYVYQFPDIDEDLTLLYGILDTLGLQLNPQIIWDATPYSFIADWFYNLGDFLAQLRKKWIPVSIHIKDFGVSRKFDYSSTSSCIKLGKVDGPWSPRTSCHGKSYTRKPLKVDDRCFFPTESGGLTLRKFHLGALLIEQRLR